MNSSALKRYGKKAITPVLATIILIAITLIAGVAIGGFVFGLFGTLGSAPQVTEITNSVAAGAASAVAAPLACVTTAPASGSWIELKNTGASAASVVSMSLAYNGPSLTVAAPATCSVAVGGTTWITVAGLGGPVANSGDSFQGSMTLSNGAKVPFVGTFN